MGAGTWILALRVSGSRFKVVLRGFRKARVSTPTMRELHLRGPHKKDLAIEGLSLPEVRGIGVKLLGLPQGLYPQKPYTLNPKA